MAVAATVVVAMAGLAAPAQANPAPSDGAYEWALTCYESGYVAWDWLDNGSVIAGQGGSSTCAYPTGSGTRPWNATGFTVALITQVCGVSSPKFPPTLVCDYGSNVVEKSFGVGKAFKVALSSSAGPLKHCSFDLFSGWNCYQVKVTAQFDFQANASP